MSRPNPRGPRPGAPRPPSAADQHRDWLELVETTGPFLAIPPLKRVWPQGMPALAQPARAALALARAEFEPAWEALDRNPDQDPQIYQDAAQNWVRAVLAEVAGWAELLDWGYTATASSPDRRATVHSCAALRSPEGEPAVLVLLVPPTESLQLTGTDGWAASPVDRMVELLRAAQLASAPGPTLGLVTDGRWWALVSAPVAAMPASGVVDALTWADEPRTRDAFFAVLSRRQLIGGDPADRVPELFTESVAAAEDITVALGAQVRRAVELLVQAFVEADAEQRRLGGACALPDGHLVYQGCVTSLMQVVFLLFAQERRLLPQSQLFTEGYGISAELDTLERRALAHGEESLDATSMSWHRLASTNNALFTGSTFDDVRIPAYGGSLFNRTRFEFLTATNEHGNLLLPIPDRVVLHILRSVQIAQLGSGDARRISFREIDVEQIGYIYEGLLGYTCEPITAGAMIGLTGPAGAEAEIPLAVLDQLAATTGYDQPGPVSAKALATAIVAWAKLNQPGSKLPSATALTKQLLAEPTGEALRQLRALTEDPAVRERLRRWLPIARLDLRGRPVLLLPGGLVVAETAARSQAGAHYTPKALAEEVVKHTLEPLCYYPGAHQTPDRTAWQLRSSRALLNLKVADIAAGSGAFLVAAARYLADRVVEACIAEEPANKQRADLPSWAIRQVVAQCLYGADINEMAVEMCKLSLWLVSLDKALPFSFVDDKIFHGNSLLGLTDPQQLAKLNLDPTTDQQITFAEGTLESTLAEASSIRRGLATEVIERDPHRSASAKTRQLGELHRLTATHTALADAVVATALGESGKPGRKLDEAYATLREAATAHAAGQPEQLRQLTRAGLTPTVPTDYPQWQPLHWVLEAPDVLLEHGGFDAIIGNPPFLGGKKISVAAGSNLREFLVNQIARGQTGNADLVAYFLLRAEVLLRPDGVLGLVATNTLAQGDTREVGLDQVVARGLTLTRAIQSAPWPSASANLEYAAVWGARGPVAAHAVREVGGVVVPQISTQLEAAGRVDGLPMRLAKNSGLSFQGCIVLGMGFVVEPAEAADWIAEDPRNAEVLFPYLNGEDLNSRPDGSPSRWVIDFRERTDVVARAYTKPWDRVLNTVQPERSTKDGKKYPRMVFEWWKFFNARGGMRAAIAGLDEVLVITRVSKTVMPVRVPTGQVPSDSLCVFATDSFADQAVLSSSVHLMWAVKYGSSMRTDVRYTPSDVFQTLPRPKASPELAELGRVLDVRRREVMLGRGLGLTKLYNLVNDPRVSEPEVTELRGIHARIDLATLAAYGWADLDPGHGFHSYRGLVRWTFSPAARVEVMDRLLAENHRRAAAEAPTRKKTAKTRPPTNPTDGLF